MLQNDKQPNSSVSAAEPNAFASLVGLDSGENELRTVNPESLSVQPIFDYAKTRKIGSGSDVSRYDTKIG